MPSICGNDWAGLPDQQLGDWLVEGQRELVRAEAIWLQALATFDGRAAHRSLGYRSCAHWLSRTTGIPLVTAREKVRVARELITRRPQVRDALARGDISYSAARALCGLPHEADADTEGALVRAAEAGATAAELHRLVQRAKDAAEADADGAAAFAARGLYTTGGMYGNRIGHFELDAEDGELLDAAIDSVLATERANGDPVRPVDAAASTGEPTPAQRRADALITLVRLGLERLEERHPGRARTESLVLVDYETFTGVTGGGVHRTAEQVRRITCDGPMRRVVFGPASELLDIGRRAYAPTPAQRAATWARDRGCRFPNCTMTVGLQPHHVVHWTNGGETATTNLAWLCRHHHRLTHEGGWTATGNADHELTSTNPDGLTHESKPPAFRQAG